MVITELIQLLGLSQEAGEAEILEAIHKLQSQANTEPDPTRYAPIEVVKALQKKLNEALGNLNNQNVDQVVDAALCDGRLLPFQEDWARRMGNKDIESLKEYLDQVLPIAALCGTQTGGIAPVGVK